MSGDYLEKYVMRPPIAGGMCTAGDEGGFVLGPDDVLVINHGPKAYPLRHDEVRDARARLDEILPGLGARTAMLAVQDVLIARGAAATRYVRVADLAAELGITPQEALAVGQRESPVMFLVGMAPSGRIITDDDAARIRAAVRREQDERAEGDAQRVEAAEQQGYPDVTPDGTSTVYPGRGGG